MKIVLSLLPRHEVLTICETPSLTDQSSKNSTDVNIIMEQFASTGMLPQRTDTIGVYQDNTIIPPLETSLQAQKHANELFLSLPLDVRTRLHHNPENLPDFISNPENQEYCLKMGLLTLKQTELGTKHVIQEIRNLADALKTTQTGENHAGLPKSSPSAT